MSIKLAESLARQEQQSIEINTMKSSLEAQYADRINQLQADLSHTTQQ